MELERAGERRRRLLGSLADVIGNAVFRGDQLVGGALRFRPASFQACLDHPQWRTLEVLDLQWRSSKALALGAFINGLPALQELKGLCRQMLPEVPCPRVRRLGARNVPVKELARLFPAVRALELPVIAPQAERSSWCENCGEMLPWLC